MKAKLGTLDTSGLPKGTGEATKLNVEGKILAYGAVQSVASQIAVKVAAAASAPAAIAIYGEKEQRGVLQLGAFLMQSAEVHKVVNRPVRPGTSGSPAVPKLESDAGACSVWQPPKVTQSTPESELGGGVAPLTAVRTVLHSSYWRLQRLAKR